MPKLIVATSVLLLAAAVSAVPPPSEFFEAVDRGEVDLDAFRASYTEARSRGVDAPNPRYGIDHPAFGPNGAFSDGVETTTMRVLILLVDFADNMWQTSPAYFDSLGYAVGSFSLRNFYSEISYADLDIVTVHWPSATGWQRAPQTYAWYVNNNYGWGAYPQNTQRLCEDLCYLVDPIVDFSQYDNDNDGVVDGVNIIYAGVTTYGPTTIWPHAWSTYNPPYLDGKWIQNYSVQNEYDNAPGDQSASTICHEFGHVLGVPDLYDYGYDSRGVGNYCVMSFGVHNGGGWSPSHPCAWSRAAFGFVAPVNVTYDGWRGLPAVENDSVVYRVWTNGNAGAEYFMVENRRPIGYDAALPAFGTLIWHIDDNVPDNDHQWYPGYTLYGHYHVALEQADGLWQLEQNINSGDPGDPYPGSTNNQFFNVGTIPDSRDYNFGDTQCAVDSIPSTADLVNVYVRVGVVGVPDDAAGLLPGTITLRAGPNPFNPTTTFSFEMPGRAHVRLDVIDVLGREVETVVDHALSAGSHSVRWDARGLPSGVYIARLQADDAVAAARVVLLK